MGQQQLLLVILVTIIVGIATVVAINTFSSQAESSNVDAVRNDLGQIGASAQAYIMKPEMMGGGGGDFTGMTFNDITFPGTVTSDTEANNENGDYTLTVAGDGSSFSVEAVPATAGGNIQSYVEADCMGMSSYDPDGSATAPTECAGASGS